LDWFDLINGLFEASGAFVQSFNLKKTYRDKMVRGIQWQTMVFFTSWGWWNILYYSHIEQPLSFYGGVALTMVNTTWCFLLAYYTIKEQRYG